MMHRNREHWSSTVVWRNPLLMGRHCRVLLGTNRYFVGGSSIDWDPAMSTLKSSGFFTHGNSSIRTISCGVLIRDAEDTFRLLRVSAAVRRPQGMVTPAW
ncbi:hypothetical protein Q1695_008114 [Nippostrongylus brasiliensis]|nr:hypothetical protein Q1695_008114 [Nippostrongylus brasiliensis]